MSHSHEPESLPRPFVAAPDANRYFPSAVSEEARQRLSRSIVRAEGPALLIGSSGTGKSLLLEVLASQFESELTVVPLSGGQICTRRALLQTILFQLDVAFEGLDEGELRLALVAYLQPRNEPLRRILLLIDEADSLPVRLLEELRLLANTTQNGQSLISLVMAGNPSLEEQFADPELAAFSQRLSTRCYLSAMGREETFQYVRAQVAAAGMNAEALFAQDGLEAIFATTDGLPRLINQLGDELMWSAGQSECTPICQQVVQRAWSSLQQLPAPWEAAQPEPTNYAGAVEFGELDAELSEDSPEIDDMPASIPISRGPAVEVDLTESYDVSEELFGPGSQDAELSIADRPAAGPLSARDPFAESFGDEEVVLDRYLGFESALLASAPQVINRLDTAFAGELSALVAGGVDGEILSQHATEVAILPEMQCLPEIDTELDFEDEVENVLMSPPEAKASPGQLLIVEDEGRPQVNLVAGKNFRQLFSSLESMQSQMRTG